MPLRNANRLLQAAGITAALYLMANPPARAHAAGGGSDGDGGGDSHSDVDPDEMEARLTAMGQLAATELEDDVGTAQGVSFVDLLQGALTDFDMDEVAATFNAAPPRAASPAAAAAPPANAAELRAQSMQLFG